MKTQYISLFVATPALLAGCLMVALLSPAFTSQGQTPQNPAAAVSPAPPLGEVWVYPTGVFPDDFYALWLAVNGAPYAAGDLPFPYYSFPDIQPGARPVFTGRTPPNGKWTVVLKARRLERAADGSCAEGAFTAFNLGLAAGTEITKDDPVPPVVYMLETGKKRFSSGFGDLGVRRAVNIQGERTPGGEERFFLYTPNFDPAANPDTNPAFEAKWLPAGYPRGSEYKPGQGYGVTSTKSVIYGGSYAFHIRLVQVDLSVSDCLLYGQYSMAIRISSPPSRLDFSNLDIRHTYHDLQLGAGNEIGILTWAIYIEGAAGGGGKHLIKGCRIDQSPTWQDYYFMANPKQGKYHVGAFPGGHAVYVYSLSKQSPGDSLRIERSTMKNCGSNVIVYDTSDVDLSIANCLIAAILALVILLPRWGVA